MVQFPDLVSQVMGITTHPDGTEVQVEVIGPKGTPDLTRELRAKARALMTVGSIPTTVKSVKDLGSMDIQRLTEQEGDPIRESRNRLMEATLHTIVVNREQ